MAKKFATWFIRFAVAAAIYATTSFVWINTAYGWDRLGVFVASIGFGLLAALAWAVAIAVGLWIANASIRLLIHPVLTVLLLVIFSGVVIIGFMDTTWEVLWDELRPFALLAAAATVADAAAGFVLAYRASAALRQAP
jgi:hypothetical protein